MNQILVTEKIYVTPELRRKKKLFKLQFFLSIFLICILFSYYIYAEYDRNKSEEVSRDILASVMQNRKQTEQTVDSTIKTVDNVIIVALEEDEEIEEMIAIEPIPSNEPATTQYTTQGGINYTIESIVRVPRLEISYPVIAETSEELLKISVNKYWGPAPNEVGNYCVVGHNYKNNKMFGRLSEAVNGDMIEIEDMSGNVVKYSVYDKYVVDPTNTACTSQLTNGRKEVTLITCTNYGTQRLIVKAREVR